MIFLPEIKENLESSGSFIKPLGGKSALIPLSDIVCPQKAAAGRAAHGICQVFRSGAAYVERGSGVFEVRMRQRTLQTVRELIKTRNINALELTAALAAV